MAAKILCPVDFSPGSQQALRVAARLARDRRAELVLAHVWHVPPLAYSGEYPLPAEAFMRMNAHAKASLSEAHEQASSLGAQEVSTLFLTGLPWAQIVEASGDPVFDLIVVGTHGRTGLSRFLLGSVAEKVVRHAPCSVLVARGEPAAFQHVLCAVDFSQASRAATQRAGELAGESIDLLHSVEPPPWYAVEPQFEGFLEDLDRRGAHVLREWAAELATKTRVPVASIVRVGQAAAQVVGVLDRDLRYDLLVVGSHGRTGIKRVLLGSVAEQLVRHARCSVLVARQRA
jgi:nucleotide-binding universal stress UspA family protein